jgi:hypothetical protein
LNHAHVKQDILVHPYLSYIECWPYPVMKNINCNAIVVVFIIVTVVLASTISFGTLIQPAAAQQFQCHIEFY